MTLRRKLLLPQIPLVLALAFVAVGALYAAFRFGTAPGEILYENFRSFDAGRSMLHALDAIDQEIVSRRLADRGGPFAPGTARDDTAAVASDGGTEPPVAGTPRDGDDKTSVEPPDGATIAAALASFERELQLQESNITEIGEDEATATLRQAWSRYRAGIDATRTLESLDAHRERSRSVRTAVDRVLELNREAMRRKSAEAKTEAEQVGAALTAAAVAAFLLAVVISGVWLRKILAPVRVLERAVERFSAGDFDARIRVSGHDEIASLSNAFNEMGTHLSRYRQSSLGELLEVNNRLESVMDSLAEAVVVYDLDGRPTAWNQTAIRLLGEDRLDLAALPEPLREVVGDAFERVRRSAEPHEPPSLEAAVELPGSPTPRWILVGATPVRTRTDTLSGVTVALRDVTRSRRIEGFKGDLVAAAAHELRTPLTSLHMAVHLCLEEAAGPLSDRQVDLLTTAREDCQRLQSVVEELLEMARLESGAARLSRSNLNVEELVRETVARYEVQARELGKAFAQLPGDALLAIEADPTRLRHVLDNLVENAFLHSGEGGRIAIGYAPRGDAVQIFLDDSGPGIPAELRRQVFAKFFRVPGTTKQGSGLGLSIVEDIVRAHGGDVGVEPSPLGGARFWFSIPIRPRGTNGQDEVSASPPSS